MTKDFFAFLIAIALVCAAFTGIMFGTYYTYQYFAPKYEQVRRETFEESQAYYDGMVRELHEARLNYAGANDAQKHAIRAMIRHDFAGFRNRRKLDTEDHSFLIDMETEK